MRSKAIYVKHSYPAPFANLMDRLYTKYGEKVFAIQGISNAHLDAAKNYDDFFGNSASQAVADVSVDSNANVREKNISQYNAEHGKPISRLNGLHLIYRGMCEMFSVEDAENAVEQVVNGGIFANDLHLWHTSYCYAVDLNVMLSDGLAFLKHMPIKPPKRHDSFVDLLIQFIGYASNQLAGAVALPSLFPTLDKFYRESYGEDYIQRAYSNKESVDDTLRKNIHNQFQNIIYSFNFPFRSAQSAFTNVSIMDKGFMEALFSDYMFPDFTKPNIESSIELGKMFFEYFSDINGKEAVFTFPVTTIAISLDENKEYIDPEFVKWAASVNCSKSFANTFQSPPTAFSSCCRLRNELQKNEYTNSFGVGGLSVGSHRVVGVNLPRLAQRCKEVGNDAPLVQAVELCHKILLTHRTLIKRQVGNGFLPLYKTGWVSLEKQYSTIGFTGPAEYAATMGGVETLRDTLMKINEIGKKYQSLWREHKYITNCECIPAETVAVRLAALDKELGYNPTGITFYSNQYVPLSANIPITERLIIQGMMDTYTDGGNIAHINIDGATALSPEQYFSIMDFARKAGCVYFGINYAYSVDAGNNIAIGIHTVHPVTGMEIVERYTRVVGFITPISAWNKTRRDHDYPTRYFGTADTI